MRRTLSVLLLAPALLVLIIVRLIRPWVLIRWAPLVSSRLGHFAANTELYLCERDAGINVPEGRYVDLFYFTGEPCNRQLATMWRRTLHVMPTALMGALAWLNRVIPGGAIHRVPDNTQHDRDVHGLLDRLPPHLRFTPEEKERGESGLRDLGIPPGSSFVCINVRDDAYLRTQSPATDWSYHDYRDCSIENYVKVSEELARRGYYVVRVGAMVRSPLLTNHPAIVDYAFDGKRSDFMDVYLGAKCALCVSNGTGWDRIPDAFRRPVCYISLVPAGYLITSRKGTVEITKHHVSKTSGQKLTLRQIFSQGAGFCTRGDEYAAKNVLLVENTPDEIRDCVIEMIERMEDTWRPAEQDGAQQKRFWEIFPVDALDPFEGKPLHGVVTARYSADYLRNNPWWLE